MITDLFLTGLKNPIVRTVVIPDVHHQLIWTEYLVVSDDTITIF